MSKSGAVRPATPPSRVLTESGHVPKPAAWPDPPPQASERAALFRVSAAVMAQAFGLPDGAYIDAVIVDAAIPGEMTLRIRGTGFPVEIGRAIPYVYPIVTVHTNDAGEVTKRTVEWGFPKDAPVLLDDPEAQAALIKERVFGLKRDSAGGN